MAPFEKRQKLALRSMSAKSSSGMTPFTPPATPGLSHSVEVNIEEELIAFKRTLISKQIAAKGKNSRY